MFGTGLSAARVAVCASALLCTLATASTAAAQSVGFGEVRPFVTALIPVVGPSGQVGGVSVDARGVLARSEVDATAKLGQARLRSLVPGDSQLSGASSVRKISLRGLQEAIEQCRQSGRPLSDEMQRLAGLTRVEFVFVDPAHRDIVLAGPADGDGGTPPVLLDDLVVALRTAKAAASDRGISCSIDPTEEGLRRVKPLLNARTLNEGVVSRLEQALGEQQITITGVPASSHFARVLVAADFLMKRLGMKFEAAPIDGLPSYLEMLQARTAPSPKNAMPRWWMAPHYEPLLKDADGLAWQLRGSGVQTLSEEGYLQSIGGGGQSGKEEGLSKKWADAMTSNYKPLATALPVFAELRNCMDLAVVAALLVKENLPAKADCDLSLLLDERRIAIAKYAVPKTVDSRASLVRKGSNWILSLSGGVQVDSWSVLQRVETSVELANKHREATVGQRDQWWWD